MQIAIQMQCAVQGLLTIVQKPEMTTQMTTTKMEDQIQLMAQQAQEQKKQSVQEAQVAKEAQEKITQHLFEVQKAAQSIVTMSQHY